MVQELDFKTSIADWAVDLTMKLVGEGHSILPTNGRSFLMVVQEVDKVVKGYTLEEALNLATQQRKFSFLPVLFEHTPSTSFPNYWQAHIWIPKTKDSAHQLSFQLYSSNWQGLVEQACKALTDALVVGRQLNF